MGEPQVMEAFEKMKDLSHMEFSSGMESSSETLLQAEERVQFDEMGTTCFANWQEVELSFRHLDGHSVAPGDKIKIYKYGWEDAKDFVIELDSSTFYICPLAPSYAAKFYVSELDPDCIYQACYMVGDEILGRSGLFRILPNDDADELIVLKPAELAQLMSFRSSYRVAQADCKMLQHKLRVAQRSLEEEQSKTSGLSQEIKFLSHDLFQQKALTKDLQKEASFYKGMYEEKETELTHKVSEMTATLREMDILKCDHQSLEEDCELLSKAYENTKEQLCAHESTKLLLHSELVSLKESKGKCSEKLSEVMAENGLLREEVERLCLKPLVADATVGTSDEEEAFDNEVNNNVVLSTCAATELEDKVKELIARLNAAADEYTKLYKENKRQERLLTLCGCVDRGKDKPACCVASSTSGTVTSSRGSQLLEPEILHTRNVSASAPAISELKDSCIQCSPVLLDTACGPSETSRSNQGCQACPPSQDQVFETGFQATSGGVRMKMACRGLSGSSDSSVSVCGKSRKMGHMSTSIPSSWRKNKPLARDRKAKTVWNLPVVSCSVTRPEAVSQENLLTETPKFASGIATPPVRDDAFVVIEMPEPSHTSVTFDDSENMMAPCCSICSSVPIDLEDHLRAMHMKQLCPICSEMFDTTLPPMYLQLHVDDHFRQASCD